jgi:hypothetical protein
MMMKTKTLLAALAMSSLVLAQPAAAAARSVPAQGNAAVAADRAGSVTSDAEEVAGGFGSVWIILLVAAVVAALIVLTTDSDDAPTSP